MKAAIVYWSAGGNTKKVAEVIRDTLSAAGIEVQLATVKEAAEIDYFDYDLFCFGFPSYHWAPPAPVDRFLKAQFKKHQDAGLIRIGAPAVPGKHALVFVTYGGPHAGIDEATPAGDYAGMYFHHAGIPVLEKIYTVGQFHRMGHFNVGGILGDIRGRPNADDLRQVRERVESVIERLGHL